MLDFRHETFLVLCKIKNYTKTAEALYITQPAVTQHIKYLEKHYGTKLFQYEGKTLVLTKQGKLLQDAAMTIRADSERLLPMMAKQNRQQIPLNFGATLSIGEYVMPKILPALLQEYPDLNIKMAVDNTQVLLSALRDGKIDFALLEGMFNTSDYYAKIFSKEEFIAICAKDSPLANQKVNFDKILDHRLILREKGSGTREVFEQSLLVHNLTIESFERICEIGNMAAIKELVAKGLGISFVYKTAVLKELMSGELYQIHIEDFSILREFNFVFLKNSIHKIEYLQWYQFLKKQKEVSKDNT